jgi:hypothetical protein
MSSLDCDYHQTAGRRPAIALRSGRSCKCGDNSVGAYAVMNFVVGSWPNCVLVLRIEDCQAFEFDTTSWRIRSRTRTALCGAFGSVRSCRCRRS